MLHVDVLCGGHGLVDAAPSAANGAANLAAIRAAITAVPDGGTILLPIPVTGFYVELPSSGTCFTISKNVTFKGGDGTAAKLKFGPEAAGYGITAFEVADGKVLTLDAVNLEGPTDPNGQIHQCVRHLASSGAVRTRGGTTISKWAQGIKAEGVGDGTGSIVVDVDDSTIISNGLGNCILSLGGTVRVRGRSVLDMVGGTSLQHNIYAYQAVNVETEPTVKFLNAGGYNVQLYGGTGTATFCRISGNFMGIAGNGAIITNPTCVTQIDQAVIPASAVVIAGETIISGSIIANGTGLALAPSTGTGAHEVRCHHSKITGQIVNAEGGDWYFDHGTIDGTTLTTIISWAAGSLYIGEGQKIKGGAANNQQINATAGKVVVSDNAVLDNAASDLVAIKLTAPATLDIGDAIVTQPGLVSTGP